MTPKVSLVVLSFNRAEYTARTLDCLKSVPAGIEYELIVVDNGSRPEAVKLLSDRYNHGKIDKLILLPENTGTSRGFNSGFKVADTRSSFLTKLDNDICVTSENWLRRLVDVLEANKQIGIASTDITNHSVLGKLDSTTLDSGHCVKDWDHFKAGGGGMTFSRKLYRKLDGFSESFPGLKLMPDDVDFHRRASNLGYRGVYVVDSHSKIQREIDYPDYAAWSSRQYELLKSRFFRVAKGGSDFRPYIFRIECNAPTYCAGDVVEVQVSVASSEATSVCLGMSLRSQEGKATHDADHDEIQDIKIGEQVITRLFTIPFGFPVGSYDIVMSLREGRPGKEQQSGIVDKLVEIQAVSVESSDSPGPNICEGLGDAAVVSTLAILYESDLSKLELLLDIESPLIRKSSSKCLVDFFLNLQFKAIRPSCFIEIGAYSAEISMRIKKTLAAAKCFAFEANPCAHAHFVETQGFDSLGIDYIHAAVSSETCNTTFDLQTSIGGSKGDRIHDGNSLLGQVNEANADERPEVLQITLDDFLRQQNLQMASDEYASLWIDVEGVGITVLSGAEQTLRRTATVLIEVEDKSYWRG